MNQNNQEDISGKRLIAKISVVISVLCIIVGVVLAFIKPDPDYSMARNMFTYIWLVGGIPSIPAVLGILAGMNKQLNNSGTIWIVPMEAYASMQMTEFLIKLFISCAVYVFIGFPFMIIKLIMNIYFLKKTALSK